MSVIIDKKLCLGCGCCMDVCPVGALEFLEGKAWVNEEEDIECGSCIDMCPNEAISL